MEMRFAGRAAPYSHQLNGMSEAPAWRFFPPRAVAPERGGAEGRPLRRKTLFLAFYLPGWGFGRWAPAPRGR